LRVSDANFQNVDKLRATSVSRDPIDQFSHETKFVDLTSASWFPHSFSRKYMRKRECLRHWTTKRRLYCTVRLRYRNSIYLPILSAFTYLGRKIQRN